MYFEFLLTGAIAIAVASVLHSEEPDIFKRLTIELIEIMN
jgi:dihydroorotate dehydrogenase